MVVCCSLKSWTITASLYSLTISMLSLQWTAQILMSLSLRPGGNFLNKHDFLATIMDRKAILLSFTWVTLTLSILWMLTAAVMIHGNAYSRVIFIIPWLCVTTLRTFWNIGTGIHFAIRLSKSMSDGKIVDSNQYLILLIFFSGGFFITCTINVILIFFVLMRCKEINNKIIILRGPSSSVRWHVRKLTSFLEWGRSRILANDIPEMSGYAKCQTSSEQSIQSVTNIDS